MKKLLITGLVLMIPSLVSAATLSVSPSSQTVNVGDTFTVNVRLDTQGESIDGVDLRYLSYNPSLLQVVDSESAAGVQIAPGTLMPATLLNSVDNSAGKISFSQVVLGGTKYKGSGTLATVKLKAIAGGTANLTFGYAPGNTTDSNIAAAGSDVLNAVVNGSYVIRGGTTPYVAPPSVPGTVPTVGITPRTNTKTPFVPLPPDEPEDIQAVPDSHSFSFREFFSYIFSRIMNGVVKIFGK